METRILLIDDDENEFVITRDILSFISHGAYKLDWVSSYQEGLKAVREKSHDVFLVDYHLRFDEPNGIELIREARRLDAAVPLILLTGVGDYERDVEAMRSGASDYLDKGQFTPEILERCLRYALERVRTGLALRDAEKLSAIGRFAAGIAHDINNPVTIIYGASAAVLEKVEPASPLYGPLRMIQRSANRCALLVQSLLRFSRKEEEAPAEFDLGEALGEVLDLIEAQARHCSVKVVKDFEAGPARIFGHRCRVEQVVINLATNAIDAMPGGGRLTFRARSSRTNGAPEVRLEVADTGNGIPPEIQGKVFETFFTTKPPGLGTGLGLSMAMEIVSGHGGKIDFKSEPGLGTTFFVTLPLAYKEVSHAH